MSVEVHPRGGARKRKVEENLGSKNTWKTNLEERWSVRKCAIIGDGDSWLSGGPNKACIKKSTPHAKPQRQGSSGKGANIDRSSSSQEPMCQVTLSPSLAGLLGKRQLSRADVVSLFLAMCKKKGLLNPLDKGEILFPPRMAKIFGRQTARVSSVLRFLGPHLSGPDASHGQPPETTRTRGQRRKRKHRPDELDEEVVAPTQRGVVSSCMGTEDDQDMDTWAKSMEEDAALLDMDSDVDAGKGSLNEASVETSRWKRWVELRPLSSGSNLVPFQRTLHDSAQSSPLDVAAGTTAAARDSTGRGLVTAGSAPPRRRGLQHEFAKPSTPEASLSCRAAPEPGAWSAVEKCTSQLVPQLSKIGLSKVSVAVRCKPEEAVLHFEVVAEPTSQGSINRAARRAHEAAWWREPCAVRVREVASGELEAFGEVELSGLEPEFAYRVFIEVHPTTGNESSCSHNNNVANDQVEDEVFRRSVEVMLPQRARPSLWSPEEVLQWCLSVKVPELARKAEEYSINGETLLSLSEEDIRSLGVTAPFLLRRVLRALLALHNSQLRSA